PHLALFTYTHPPSPNSFFFFFNDTATTDIYTLSLHDALPISPPSVNFSPSVPRSRRSMPSAILFPTASRTSSATSSQIPRPSSKDRKSTRLNSSHSQISYAVFCLKKKKKNKNKK